jgi:transposase
MAMGTRRKRRRQESLWIPVAELPSTAAHPFYQRLNAILDDAGFDRFVEQACQPFYAPTMGRPSLVPGIYFRLLLIGYFEGLDSERGIAWRAADSLAIRRFLRVGLDEGVADHTTISRTRRLIDVETHRAVFTWIQQRLVERGLLTGGPLGIDGTTLEANAALRSIVRRDTGDTYHEFLTKLAQASGIATPTREDLAKIDQKRPKKGSNDDWQHPQDPDASITKMKDGRTHLAHKAEHAVDLKCGAIVAVTVQRADAGDTQTIQDTLVAAAEQLEATVGLDPDAVLDVVTDKGYHSNEVLTDLHALGVRTYMSEPQRGRRTWTNKAAAQRAVYANRRRIRGNRGQALGRQRGERLERSFAHTYDTGRMRRTGAPQHPEARAGARRRLQPGPRDACADRRGHPAGAPGPRGGAAGHARNVAPGPGGLSTASRRLDRRVRGL